LSKSLHEFVRQEVGIRRPSRVDEGETGRQYLAPESGNAGFPAISAKCLTRAEIPSTRRRCRNDRQLPRRL